MDNRRFALLLASTLVTACVDGVDGDSDPTKVESCPVMSDNATAFVATTYPADDAPNTMGPAALGVDRVAARIADPRWNDGTEAVLDPSLDVPAIVGAPIGGGSEAEGPVVEPEVDEPGAGGDTGSGNAGSGDTGSGDTGSGDTGSDDTGSGGSSDPVETVDPVSVPDPIFATPYDTSVDPLQAVPMSMVDMSKDFVWTPQFVWPESMANFTTTGLQPGDAVPDFTLWNLEGKQVKLSQYKGVSNLVIIMGSASCMVFRRQSLSMWSALKQTAATAMAKTGKKLEILIVFTKEAHPAAEPSVYLGKQWLGIENVEDKVLVSMSKTFAERVTLARGLDARIPLDKPNVWIDGMDDAVWKLLGSVPNGMFLIDIGGHLAWKELWAMQTGMGFGEGQMPNGNAKPTAFTMIEKLVGL